MFKLDSGTIMAELGTNLIISTVTSVHVSLVELQTKVREDFTITALLHYIHNKDTWDADAVKRDGFS